MCILTAVQVRKRTSLGPVYLVPHGTVIPPGDGSQKQSVRTTSWCTTAVEVEAQACGKCDTTFISYYLYKRDWHEDTSGKYSTVQ